MAKNSAQKPNPQPIDPMTGTNRDPVPGPSLEEIEAKQAKFEEESSVHVIRDEWQGQLETGNPFDDTARPFVEANPDKEFRFLSTRDSVMKRRGRRGYQQITDESGKPVECAGMPLGWIPKAEAQRRTKAKLAAATVGLERIEGAMQEQIERTAHDAGLKASELRTKNDDEIYEGSRRIA